MIHPHKKAELSFSKPSDFHSTDPEIENQTMNQWKDESASVIALKISEVFSQLQGLHNAFMVAQVRQLDAKREDMREQFSQMIAEKQRKDITKVFQKKGVLAFLHESGIDVAELIEQVRTK